MTDVRREWISKRAYTIWEEAGRPHGLDAEHWEQAVRERDEFERVALDTNAKPAKKPLIEISGKAKAPTSAKARKKADPMDKPAARAKPTKVSASAKDA